MIPIVIDNIQFEVWGDHTLWSPPKADGAFVEAPEGWSKIARALVCCDYEDRGEHTYVAGSQLLEHFIDTHDDKGRKVPGGRPSGLHFNLAAGMPPIRAKRVMTGKLEGDPVITVLEWDDPLNNVMTTREVAEVFNLDDSTPKKGAQEGWIPARKSGGIWLIRRFDAEKRWS